MDDVYKSSNAEELEEAAKAVGLENETDAERIKRLEKMVSHLQKIVAAMIIEKINDDMRYVD